MKAPAILCLGLCLGLLACEMGDPCPFTREPGQCTSMPVNRITEENLNSGADDWWIPYPQWSMNHEVEGYTDRPSYAAGEAIQVSISNRAGGSVLWRMYRLGWYQGKGARLIASGTTDAPAQPLPPTSTWDVPCRPNWPTTLTIPVGEDAVSGIYALRLDAGDSASFITFVIREDERAADILVQRSDFTDAMYNNWDGATQRSSWYGDHPQWVSLDRVQRSQWGTLYPYSAGFFTYEVSMLRFLERQGYDVKYASNLDVHRDEQLLDRVHVFMSVGHDEYWTREMRDHVEDARDRGVHLAFFSTDTCDGVLRMSPDDPHLISVTTPDSTPKVFTRDTWGTRPVTPGGRPHDNPSDTLTGTHYGGWCGIFRNECLDDSFGKLRLTDEPTVTLPTHPVFRSIGPDYRLGKIMGYEYEVRAASMTLPKNLQRLAQMENVVELTDGPPLIVAYQTDAGAKVFNVGSAHFSHGLDAWAGESAFRRFGQPRTCEDEDLDCFFVESKKAQQVTINVLADMNAFRHSPKGGLSDPEACDWNMPAPGCSR